jgi:hypothetical protein
MWKSNRKDECYDVYLDACQDSFERLLVAENKVGVLLYMDVCIYSMLQCRPQVGTAGCVHHPGLQQRC